MGAACCNSDSGNAIDLSATDEGESKSQEAAIAPVVDQQPVFFPKVETSPQQEVVETEKAAPPQEAVESEKEQQVEEKTPAEEKKPASVEEKPSPPPPAAELVRLVFSTPDGEKSVDLKRRPLGLWFDRSVPLKINAVTKEFAGAAAGIKEGWTMISVNGEDISKPPMIYANALAILDTYVKKLPQGTSNVTSVDIVFGCSGETDATFKAQWSPLDITFMKQQMPITVSHSGSYGRILGIRPGMVFKSVGGADVSTCGSYDEALALLKKSMDVLPVLGSSAILQSQVSCR
jgi:hypothetical protein